MTRSRSADRRRAATHAPPTPDLVALHPSSEHTLAGSPPGNLRELTLRRGEPVVRFTIAGLGTAERGNVGDIDAKVLGYREARVPEPGTRPVDHIAVRVPNQPAPTRGTR